MSCARHRTRACARKVERQLLVVDRGGPMSSYNETIGDLERVVLELKYRPDGEELARLEECYKKLPG